MDQTNNVIKTNFASKESKNLFESSTQELKEVMIMRCFRKVDNYTILSHSATHLVGLLAALPTNHIEKLTVYCDNLNATDLIINECIKMILTRYGKLKKVFLSLTPVHWINPFDSLAKNETIQKLSLTGFELIHLELIAACPNLTLLDVRPFHIFSDKYFIQSIILTITNNCVRLKHLMILLNIELPAITIPSLRRLTILNRSTNAPVYGIEFARANKNLHTLIIFGFHYSGNSFTAADLIARTRIVNFTLKGSIYALRRARREIINIDLRDIQSFTLDYPTGFSLSIDEWRNDFIFPEITNNFL